MMFVKVYRYRVRPEMTESYLDLQRRAARVYGSHMRFTSVHLQSTTDPVAWVEVQWFEDEAAFRKGMELVDADPEVRGLWNEFKGVLDPRSPEIVEETYELALGFANLKQR